MVEFTQQHAVGNRPDSHQAIVVAYRKLTAFRIDCDRSRTLADNQLTDRQQRVQIPYDERVSRWFTQYIDDQVTSVAGKHRVRLLGYGQRYFTEAFAADRFPDLQVPRVYGDNRSAAEHKIRPGEIIAAWDPGQNTLARQVPDQDLAASFAIDRPDQGQATGRAKYARQSAAGLWFGNFCNLGGGIRRLVGRPPVDLQVPFEQLSADALLRVGKRSSPRPGDVVGKQLPKVRPATAIKSKFARLPGASGFVQTQGHLAARWRAQLHLHRDGPRVIRGDP